MHYYAVFLPMLDREKSAEFRPQHLAYLHQKREEGKIFANGPFVDGWGGLVIYIADSFEEAEALVQNDPYIFNEARTYEIHEWAMVTNAVLPDK